MKKSPVLKVLTAIVACVAIGPWTQNAFAQRGGHGGAGGFRGGSAMGFRGGSVAGLHSGSVHYGDGRGISYGVHHGGAYYNGRGHGGYHTGYQWQGGHHGWHAGWWYPYYGYGWGWGWGLGWPYGSRGYYPYAPWVYAPFLYYSYPAYCPPGYSCPFNGSDGPPPANSHPKREHSPAEPWRPDKNIPEDKSTPDRDDGNSNDSATYDASVLPTDRGMLTASNYRVAQSATQGFMPVRSEVQDAMRALREMPPFARLREIETGRYSHFTDEERALLRNVK